MSHTGSAAMCHGTAVTTRRTTASADRQLMPVPAVVRLGSHPVALWCSRAAAPQRAAVDSADAHRCARVMPRTQHPTSACTNGAGPHTRWPPGSTTTVHSTTAAERRLLRAYTKDTQRRARTSACGHESATYKEHGPARARDGRTQRVQLQRVRGAFTLVCAVNKASRRSQRTLRTPRAPKALGVTRSVTPRRSDRASTPASPRTRHRG